MSMTVFVPQQKSKKVVPMSDRRSARTKLTRCRSRLKEFCKYVLEKPRPTMEEIREEAQRHLEFLEYSNSK